MRDKKLLVCICFHYTESRVEILKKTLQFLDKYEMNVDIIIDTNSEEFRIDSHQNIRVFVHKELGHPFYLTFMHRQHFINEIDNYDWFMYIEDDMGVPFENFKEYTVNFFHLWPNYVPGFVRIETFDGKNYVVDVLSHKHLNYIIQAGDKKFFDLTDLHKRKEHGYHAFWIMPKEELKATMGSVGGFFRLSIDREWAASFPQWELGKIPLVLINDNGTINELSYSYHLSNNYASDGGVTPVAKIEVDKIFNI